jgi:hypothetical protein
MEFGTQSLSPSHLATTGEGSILDMPEGLQLVGRGKKRLRELVWSSDVCIQSQSPWNTCGLKRRFTDACAADRITPRLQKIGRRMRSDSSPPRSCLGHNAIVIESGFRCISETASCDHLQRVSSPGLTISRATALVIGDCAHCGHRSGSPAISGFESMTVGPDQTEFPSQIRK